ncbi:hypothetical protein G7Z17_g11886 [Cylindrodendrum hubeiense]|uniref:MNN4-regulates the mannosylphosphorylation n=1 Tax=Cylindrodendrum hubeiense TaxID=595255 RepID=A0A9P5GV43_9HYPO|nr:hypothetical protein G7Z17_g11886 [Cylindrodendrum hubeiense]
MFRISRSLLRFTSRASSTARVSGTSLQFSPASFPQAYRVALFSSKPTDPPPNQSINSEHEKKLAQKTLKSDPSAVSTESSVRHVIEESQSPENKDHDMGAELKHDINVIKDTLSFSSVPRESHILGLAGTLPYMGTSLSTLFLSWDLNKDLPTGNSLYDSVLIDHDTARYLLSVIEPIQLGYGAVLISFLGAIHWGLEYAEKQPHLERTRFRYGVGLAASIVAWPTLFMSVEYALTTQFMAFVALYFVDSRATTRGWAPHWYGTYRFLLTAMVGLAIFISLVGRAKIGQGQALSSRGLEERIDTPGMADRTTDWAKIEKEEMERVKKEKEEAEKKAKKEEQKSKQEEMKAEKGFKESDDTKSEDDESEDKESEDKKSEDGESEDKTSEDKESGEKKSDNKKSDNKKSEDGDEDGDGAEVGRAERSQNKDDKSGANEGSKDQEKAGGEDSSDQKDESAGKDKSTKKKKGSSKQGKD